MMPVATAQTELSVQDKKLQAGLNRGIGLIKKYGASVARGLAIATAAFVAVGGAALAASAVFLKMFSDAERSQKRLEAVVKATGGAAGYTADQLGQMAQQLQVITGLDAEMIKDTEAIIATFKEIRGDEFKDATVAVLDMSAVLGQDAKAGAIQLGKALNDPIRGVTALRRVGVSFTEQQLEQIRVMQESGNIIGAQRVILDELKNEFGGAAEALGDTFGGRVMELRHRLGDLGEEIGEALVPAAEWLIEKVDALSQFIENNIDTLKSWIRTTTEVGQMVGDWLVDKLVTLIRRGIEVYTGFETVVTNWRDVIEYAMSAALHTIVKFVNQVGYFFTEVLPANLEYLGSVFVAVFKNVGDFVKTFFSNLWDNVTGFFKSLWNKIKGRDANWEWTGLTEGFEMTRAKMTEVAERVPGELEQALKRQMDDAGARLGDSFVDSMKKRSQKYEDFLKGLEGLSLEERRERAKEELAKIAAGEGGARGTGEAKEKKRVKASFEGLAESWKRITQAATAQDEQKQDIKRTAEATEKAANAAEKQKKIEQDSLVELKKININFDKLAVARTSAFFSE